MVQPTGTRDRAHGEPSLDFGLVIEGGAVLRFVEYMRIVRKRRKIRRRPRAGFVAKNPLSHFYQLLLLITSM